MKKIQSPQKILLLSALILLTGGLMACLDGQANWLHGWLAYSLLLGIGVCSLVLVWRLISPIRTATSAAAVAFGLRLVFGVGLTILLPIVGYANNTEHQAGYVFTDAYIRDTQAWELASSNQPISQAFSGKFSGDQYGGMLAINAFLYRTLSMDAHRPMLIMIINATAAALGVLLLWKALNAWFGNQTAIFAAWLFALYPESVLLGSSQMREALVIPAIAIVLYGISQYQSKQKYWWGWLALAGLILFPIQPLAGYAALSVVIGFFILDPTTLQRISTRRILLYAGIFLALVFVLVLLAGTILVNLPSVHNAGPFASVLTWLRNNFTFQSYISERGSGMLQKLLDSTPVQWQWLVILVYGIAQPVLPAMLGDPSAAWIMRIMGFFRALGWYVLAPFLIYSLIRICNEIFFRREEPRRWQLLWLSLSGWVWIAISALNAGGDQWDNPRYRTIFLPFLLILAGWSWNWARQHRDVWLGRWLLIEVFFVTIFGEWYLGRYYPGFPHLDIKIMIFITLSLSALVLGGGWLWDRYHRKIR